MNTNTYTQESVYLQQEIPPLAKIFGDHLKQLSNLPLMEVIGIRLVAARNNGDSFIILDEAQNTTSEQMKMFLTRLGFGSKVVITGDVTQIDLPRDKTSGLKDAIRVLEGVKDIAICRLTSADVVRHALVQEIINAYEKADKKQEVKRSGKQFSGSYQRKK